MEFLPDILKQSMHVCRESLRWAAVFFLFAALERVVFGNLPFTKKIQVTTGLFTGNQGDVILRQESRAAAPSRPAACDLKLDRHRSPDFLRIFRDGTI